MRDLHKTEPELTAVQIATNPREGQGGKGYGTAG